MNWLFLLFVTVVLLFGFVVFFGAPYVPSKKRDIKLAFDELYRLSKKDVLVDIGSGDGVVLRMAQERGARAVGYELNPILVMISQFLSRRHIGVSTVLADFWRVQLPDDTTVVYTFGESRDIKKMAAKVQAEATRLNKSLVFISYGFAVPGWEPTRQTRAHFLYDITPLQQSQP